MPDCSDPATVRRLLWCGRQIGAFTKWPCTRLPPHLFFVMQTSAWRGVDLNTIDVLCNQIDNWGSHMVRKRRCFLAEKSVPRAAERSSPATQLRVQARLPPPAGQTAPGHTGPGPGGVPDALRGAHAGGAAGRAGPGPGARAGRGRVPPVQHDGLCAAFPRRQPAAAVRPARRRRAVQRGADRGPQARPGGVHLRLWRPVPRGVAGKSQARSRRLHLSQRGRLRRPNGRQRARGHRGQALPFGQGAGRALGGRQAAGGAACGRVLRCD